MHVLVRHCFASENSVAKPRPAGFCRESLLRALAASCAAYGIDVTVILDAGSENTEPQPHFAESCGLPVKRIAAGSDAGSFRACIEFGLAQPWPDSDIVVFLEDDFKVGGAWPDAVREGLAFAPFVTLYDHPDKYTHPMYSALVSRVFRGATRHWRTTPSTVNSYACTMKTLRDTAALQLSFADPAVSRVTRDHEKFLALWSAGYTLVSSMPAAWSHEEDGMQCAIVD